eukprot:s4238_g6.t1
MLKGSQKDCRTLGCWFSHERGTQTVLQQVKPSAQVQPLPILHVSPDGVEGERDADEAAVMKYAKEHPDEDREVEDAKDAQKGGESLMRVSPHEFQAVEIPEMPDEEMEEMIAAAEKRDRERETTLPVPSRQRLSDPEASKRPTGSQAAVQAKFVKFDHTASEEKKSKQQKTGMFSPTFAGDIVSCTTSSSPAAGSGHVRRVIEDVELYDEDDVGEEVPLESWDWDTNDQLLDGDFSQFKLSEDEKAKRGFFNEDAGPPDVSAEEMAYMDKEAMYVELDRLRQLEVIDDVQAGIDVSEALRLDTKLVRDWRFRQGQWIRRARMVAREFRGQSASTEETFSPTTPLMMVKVLMVISLLRNLMLSALDVSDAFLQVLQKENVVISVPNRVRVAARNLALMFWQLRKCLPGQRNAATRWNDHLTQILGELNFSHMHGTLFRHREREIFISAHIDDLLLVASRADTEEIYGKLSQKLTLKKDGPYGADEPGRLFYLKRQVDIGEDGIYIAPNAKYIPKLVELLEITERRGKSVPHHSALTVFDSENISPDEYLDTKDAKKFRSARGICFFLAQGRLDIQQTVRVLSSYMGRPTKTALCALRKLGSYLMQTQDMQMHYPRAELFATTMTRWLGVDERRDGRPYEIELYSDSDWASCKVTRRSTSSGLIFLNGCCVHSHSRAQMSISLSSMEAEILAATSLLVEGIQMKQLLQFLLGDAGGLSNNAQVQMRLRLDSTSAQTFFKRLGPGRAKHLSTRLLWSQQAMRKKWFLVERIGTRENPAGLNTKPLSRERREYLQKKIGPCSSTFPEEENEKIKQIVRLVTAMVMSGSLQGCDSTWSSSTTSSAWWNPISWTTTAWWTLTTILLIALVGFLVNKVNKLNAEVSKYKIVWESIRSTMNLTARQDPFSQDDLPDARREPFSGVRYEQEDSEEETVEMDAPTTDDGGDDPEGDREEPPQPPRICLQNGTHGASPGDRDELPSERGEPSSGSAHPDGEVPSITEGIEIMT